MLNSQNNTELNIQDKNRPLFSFIVFNWFPWFFSDEYQLSLQGYCCNWEHESTFLFFSVLFFFISFTFPSRAFSSQTLIFLLLEELALEDEANTWWGLLPNWISFNVSVQSLEHWLKTSSFAIWVNVSENWQSVEDIQIKGNI